MKGEKKFYGHCANPGWEWNSQLLVSIAFIFHLSLNSIYLKKYLSFIEHLLGIRHGTGYFMYIIILSLYNNLKNKYYDSLFHRRKNHRFETNISILVFASGVYGTVRKPVQVSSVTLVMSNSLQPYGLYPIKLLCHGILQTRILEWIAMPSSRGSSWPWDRTCVSCVSCIAGGLFTTEPPGKPHRQPIKWEKKKKMAENESSRFENISI